MSEEVPTSPKDSAYEARQRELGFEILAAAVSGDPTAQQKAAAAAADLAFGVNDSERLTTRLEQMDQID